MRKNHEPFHMKSPKICPLGLRCPYLLDRLLGLKKIFDPYFFVWTGRAPVRPSCSILTEKKGFLDVHPGGTSNPILCPRVAFDADWLPQQTISPDFWNSS